MDMHDERHCRQAPPGRFGDLPRMELDRSLSGHRTAPRYARRPRRAAAAAAKAFEARWKGTLAAAARNRRRARLREAVADYEAIEELIGRIISYAGLVYAGDTSDPAARQVLWRRPGEDHRSELASAVLRARTQPPRRRRARGGAGRRTPRSAITGRGSRICARTSPTSSRTAIEQLFHEKSMTGRAAWNRLFDETMAACVSTSTARSWRSSRR